MNTAHGYVIWGGGFKLVTKLEETKEGKCNASTLHSNLNQLNFQQSS